MRVWSEEDFPSSLKPHYLTCAPPHFTSNVLLCGRG